MAAENDTLKIQTPDGWNLEYKGTNGLDSYLVTPNKTETVCTFNKLPAPINPEDIPATLREMADGILKDSKGRKEITVVSEKYEVVAFEEEQCKGDFIDLKIVSNTKKVSSVNVVFMMTIKGQTWNGFFLGTAEQWTQALAMLKSIKIAN